MCEGGRLAAIAALFNASRRKDGITACAPGRQKKGPSALPRLSMYSEMRVTGHEYDVFLAIEMVMGSPEWCLNEINLKATVSCVTVTRLYCKLCGYWVTSPILRNA